MIESPPPDVLARVRQAASVLFFTGAGMSAESGIATFRDANSGLWSRFDPQELATPEAFRKDPVLVWNWYEWRRMQVLQARPHQGHLAIARLQGALPTASVVTQNVDDLHERAGSHPVHLHGSLFAPRCSACARPYPGALSDDLEAALQGALRPPTCAHCGGRIRPGVVWFGEALPANAWRRAVELAKTAELLVVVGTSAVVQPAAQIPAVVRAHGGRVVEINPDPAIGADWTLAEPASTGLAKLLQVFGVADKTMGAGRTRCD